MKNHVSLSNPLKVLRNTAISLFIILCSLFIIHNSSAQTYSISGHVMYDNKDSTAMTNTKVYIALSGGAIFDSTNTDSKGYYEFVNLKNGTYNLTCSTTLPWGGVTPADALIINRIYIGVFRVLSGFIRLAADVNNDGKINPTDAKMIIERYIGLIKKFNIPDWLFSDPTVIVNGSNVTQDIFAICAGDVNGSYIP